MGAIRFGRHVCRVRVMIDPNDSEDILMACSSRHDSCLARPSVGCHSSPTNRFSSSSMVSGQIILAPSPAARAIRLPQHFPNEEGCCSKAKQPESSHHPSERKHHQGPDSAACQRPQERSANPTLATLREALGEKHAQAETSGCDDRSGERDCE